MKRHGNLMDRLSVKMHRPNTTTNERPRFNRAPQTDDRNVVAIVDLKFARKLGRLVGHEIRNVDTAPFALLLVPPDQFLALAPGFAGRRRARSIIYDATISRPGEAPAVAEIIFRLARVRLVNLIGTVDTGVNPPATCG